MTTSPYPHSFEGPVEVHDVGSDRYLYRVVWLPGDVAQALPLAEFPRLRVEGEMNDVPFESALHPVRGRWYLLLSEAFLKRALPNGDGLLDVRFAVADQNAVSIPDELAELLEFDSTARSAWSALSPGKRRFLAHPVSTAKRKDTRERRARKVIEDLKN